MNDPLIARFAEACGAVGPLDLRVGIADGGVLAEGSVHQPFTLIGRDDACDVTLTDPDVNPRHAWLQVIDGRVYAVDLGSRSGLVWRDGVNRPGWLDVGSPVRVGPFFVHLRSPISNRSTSGSKSDPIRPDPSVSNTRPTVQLDFRNGKRAKDRWLINRLVTLVGRAEDCKLNLNAEDISSYHCGLVLTTSGLWVVDLSGRGVVVNGERMRVAPLPHGAELWIGRFLIGCHYPAVGDTPPMGRSSTHSDETKSPVLRDTEQLFVNQAGLPTRSTNILPLDTDTEDEVPLGDLPDSDPESGLPSSHIMCDAFRLYPTQGPISSPILVAGSGPTPPLIPLSATHRNTPVNTYRNHLTVFAHPRESADPAGMAAILRQLGDIQSQTFDQFHQSLQSMVQLFVRDHKTHASAAQIDLIRIQELDSELVKLQTEMARLALNQALGGSAGALGLGATIGPGDPTPLPGIPPLSSNGSKFDAGDAIQEWIRDRVVALQKERTGRWELLSKLLISAQAGGSV